MDDGQTELARRLELHEAEAWAACVAATAEVAGNPLMAEVGLKGAATVATLGALNFGLMNRVIALGVASPATESDLDFVTDFFASRHQSRYSVEVTPVSQPRDLGESLVRHGLEMSPTRVAKLWRPLDDLPPVSTDVEVRLLTEEHLADYNKVSLAAWGTPRSFGAWYGATLGREGFRHYGVFDGEKLVSTCAMYVSGELAWAGFGVTMPDYQGRGFQRARLARELNDAAELGCTVLHNEADAGPAEEGGTSLRNMLRTGFHNLYIKDTFRSVE